MKELISMWQGIRNYHPRFFSRTSELIATVGDTLNELCGKQVIDVFIMWNNTLNEWNTSAPIIIRFNETQVELCANKLEEFSITVDEIDITLPIESFDFGDDEIWSFEWRSHPEQFRISGNVVTGLEVIEYRLQTTIIQNHEDPYTVENKSENWLLHGLGLALENGSYLCVFNSLDENGIDFKREVHSDLRYISL